MQLLTMLQCPSVIHALIFMFEEVLIAWQVQLDILSCLFLCKYNYTEHSQVRNYGISKAKGLAASFTQHSCHVSLSSRVKATVSQSLSMYPKAHGVTSNHS